MRKSVLAKSMVAALVAATAAVPSASVMAQNAGQPIRYNYRIPIKNNPILNWRRNIRLAPSAVAQAQANARPVVMTPTSGPTGTAIQVRINRSFGATPTHLRFRAYVSRGVPAQILVRLSGPGNVYTISSPIQLCIQGGGRFNVDLIYATRPNINDIGTFTSTNC